MTLVHCAGETEQSKVASWAQATNRTDEQDGDAGDGGGEQAAHDLVGDDGEEHLRFKTDPVMHHFAREGMQQSRSTWVLHYLLASAHGDVGKNCFRLSAGCAPG